ncbi:MAG: phospholipid-binding lipoprotein MlaA [Lentimonas sp.]|jgi:phospholipid-binding lipoprotein MlaA
MQRLNCKPLAQSFLLSFVLFAPTLWAQDDFLSEDDLYGEDVLNGSGVSDPFEGVNRAFFAFNDIFYREVIDRIGTVYSTVTPDPVEVGATNFFDNLKYPVRLVGNLLQGRFGGAWLETKRFVLNTTLGVGGVTRSADSYESLAPIPSEDVGQALGSWGIGTGPYLVLPFMGPSTLRDLLGLIGDRAVNPLQEPFSLIEDWEWEQQFSLTASELIVNSPSLTARYQQMKGSAIDAYGALKNGYTQYRRAAVEE